ncbi:MAG: hypothetical protein ABUT20_23320 [Bacteroidota bacterium]
MKNKNFCIAIVLCVVVSLSCKKNNRNQESSNTTDDFVNRIAIAEVPEDPLVIEYLKQVQGSAALLPSVEGENIAQTFNNSIAAFAFILKGERQRAERILDFYSSATDINNTDIRKQNFFYNGQPRGFYQSCNIATLRDESGIADRWMGDMAWLLLAYKFYEKEYISPRYSAIITLLKNLLASFYKPVSVGGYIQSGWRKGDSYLHELNGHHEGNIDAYAVLKLCSVGSDTITNIKSWIENELTTGLNNQNLPLDLYSWRTLAFGSNYVYLLNTPENDAHYRKELIFNEKKITGFYSSADDAVNNIWVDGTAHMASGFLKYGDKQKGMFYSNRLSDMLITNIINGINVKTLPYTTNNAGVYGWVNTAKGFVSCAAWYVIVKNKLNPFGTDGFLH